MRELAVRGVELAPLLGEPQDHPHLLRAQRVHRHPARLTVGQLPGASALLPVPPAPLRQAEHPTRLAEAPARRGRLGDQPQSRAFTATSTRAGTRPTSPARFPRNTTSSIACSLTVSSSRAISARAATSSPSTTPRPPPPGLELANAVKAPSRPTRRIRMIVVGSTPQRSAACRCVSSPVNNCSQICSFSSH